MSWKQRRFARHRARSCGRRFFAAGVHALSWAVALSGGLWLAHGGSAKAPPAGEDRVRQLIAELGAEQYTRREMAQQELQRLGVEAFDALLAAQHHDDIEIASRARYLLRSIPIRWTTDGDEADVKSLLRKYDEGGHEERQNRMEQLAALDDSPACRPCVA